MVVAQYLKGGILDLGCGEAHIVDRLSSDQIYVGVERHPDIIEDVLKRLPQYVFYTFDLSTEVLDINGQFDTIVMMAIIEHIKNPLHILGQLRRFLEPNGKVIITTPTIMGGYVHMIGSRLGLFYREAADEHEHLFNFKTLVSLLKQSGLRVVEFRRFLFFGNQLFVCQAA